LYPHDIEDCMLAACPSLKPGAIAAIAITDKDGVGTARLPSRHFSFFDHEMLNFRRAAGGPC
jgi:hypothetical protein